MCWLSFRYPTWTRATNGIRPCSGDRQHNNPMPTLVEWQVVPGAWVQGFNDPQRAGSGLLNFAIDDLESHLAQVRERGLDPGEIVEANKGVRLSTITDPDGNTIRFIGGFRVEY
jgi:hypothetical protein